MGISDIMCYLAFSGGILVMCKCISLSGPKTGRISVAGALTNSIANGFGPPEEDILFKKIGKYPSAVVYIIISFALFYLAATLMPL